jgi:two-component system response regulator GlrR
MVELTLALPAAKARWRMSEADERTPGPHTQPLPDRGTGAVVRRFTVVVIQGGAARVWESSGPRCSIGSHPSNDLVLDDATVSRFHCEIEIDGVGARLRDLGSRNGTVVDGVRSRDVYLRDGSVISLGRVAVRFQLAALTMSLPVADFDHFGALVGTSIAMRTTFALLERAAATDATVLLEGETGTGKELAAASIHARGARAERPLVVIDCAAIPAGLLESELFGHEKGAFTGAVTRRVGAFEEAEGGTVFLDEIGELPLELQPKLLRVLEQRQVRRLGSQQTRPVDVRILAATHRDLRIEVNEGRFRSDLYYRLAVLRVRMPALRERPDDIPVLVARMLTGLGASDAQRESLLAAGFLARLARGAWPGNVRELRNAVERSLVFAPAASALDAEQIGDVQAPADEQGADAVVSAGAADDGLATVSVPLGGELSYYDGRERALAAWERVYLETVLARCERNVEKAARVAGIGRAYFYRLLGRHRAS